MEVTYGLEDVFDYGNSFSLEVVVVGDGVINLLLVLRLRGKLQNAISIMYSSSQSCKKPTWWASISFTMASASSSRLMSVSLSRDIVSSALSATVKFEAPQDGVTSSFDRMGGIREMV
jgi:hypothetical protein